MGNQCAYSRKHCSVDSKHPTSKCTVTLPVTPEEISLLADSWQQIQLRWQEIICMAYERSFQQHPDLRPIFIKPTGENQEDMSLAESPSIRRHAKHFQRFIDTIITNIGDHKEIAKTLNVLGRRHCSYGAEQRFVTAIATNLKFGICATVETLYSDNELNCKIQNAWDSLIWFLAGMLKHGLREKEKELDLLNGGQKIHLVT